MRACIKCGHVSNEDYFCPKDGEKLRVISVRTELDIFVLADRTDNTAGAGYHCRCGSARQGAFTKPIRHTTSNKEGWACTDCFLRLFEDDEGVIRYI